MIVNYWPTWFRNLYGGEWPTSYCCFDTETSGYSFDRDVITEWGHCLVIDGVVVDQLSMVLDWTNHPVVPYHFIQNRLNIVRQGMELSGKRSHMTVERMKAEGHKPEEALTFIRDFTAKLKDAGILFVGHNAPFDERMISANLQGFGIAKGFTLGDNGFIDTEAVAKATQIPDNSRVHPKRDDTLRSYFHRVFYTRVPGIKSNLDDYCFRTYGFDTKHGIDRREMHGARMDSFCTHVLMEDFRGLITAPATPPVFPTADHQQARKSPKPVKEPVLVGAGRRVRGQRSS